MHSDYERADAILDDVTNACEEVLNQLGPGLLESVYEECLAYEQICASLSMSNLAAGTAPLSSANPLIRLCQVEKR